MIHGRNTASIWSAHLISLATVAGIAALAASTVTLSTGCKISASPSPSTSGSPTVDDSAGFSITSVSSGNYTYLLHAGTDHTPAGGLSSTSYSTSCSIASDATYPDNDLICYLETDEFDLYYNGYTLQHNVPSGMCTYFTVMPPFFYRYPAGTGPSAESYTLNASGGVSASTDTNLNGSAWCPYDYTGDPVPGPNCCLGDYTITSTDNSGSQSTSKGTWGGKLASCLDGPAMDTQKKDSNGFPLMDYFYVANGGLAGTYTAKAPLAKGYISNMYAANYYDPTITQGSGTDTYDMPADWPSAYNLLNGGSAISATAIKTNDTANGGTCPTGDCRTFTDSSGGTFPVGNPFWDYTCYDQDREVIARIRVLVRSWDKKGNVGIATSYAPTAGTEPNFGGPNHDFGIWWEGLGGGALTGDSGDLTSNHTYGLGSNTWDEFFPETSE